MGLRYPQTSRSFHPFLRPFIIADYTDVPVFVSDILATKGWIETYIRTYVATLCILVQTFWAYTVRENPDLFQVKKNCTLCLSLYSPTGALVIPNDTWTVAETRTNNQKLTST
jgi:hypothetical protein